MPVSTPEPIRPQLFDVSGINWDDEEWKKTVAYWPCKQAYLDHLEAADPRAVLVSIADKVHNARAIVTDIKRAQLAKRPALKKFNGTPEEIVKYYSECLRIGKTKDVPDTLTIPLGLAVDVIREYVEGGAT